MNNKMSGIVCSSCKKTYPTDAYTDINNSGKHITRCIKCRGAKIIQRDKFYYREKCEHDKMKYTCETCYPLFYKYIFRERLEWQQYVGKPDLMFHYSKPLCMLYGVKVSSFKTPEEINHISDLMSDGETFNDDPEMSFCLRCKSYKNKMTINQLNYCDDCGSGDVCIDDGCDDEIPEGFIICSICAQPKDPSHFVHKTNDKIVKSCNDCRDKRENASLCQHQIKRMKCAICQTSKFLASTDNSLK